MNKSSLVAEMAEKTGLSKKNTENSVNAFIDVVKEALKRGEKVQLMGFGRFETKEGAARPGRNPQTGERVDIPACKKPKFTAGKDLKDMLNA